MRKLCLALLLFSFLATAQNGDVSFTPATMINGSTTWYYHAIPF